MNSLSNSRRMLSVGFLLHLTLSLVLFLAPGRTLPAKAYDSHDEAGSLPAVTATNARGLDRVYDFGAVWYPAAPEGYEEFFVEHYGRHGSRYAYNECFYTSLHRLLEAGRACGCLTPLGKRLDEEYHRHYSQYLNRMGDLSPLGREQQKRIAQLLYDACPGVFSEGARVEACASMSSRSILSMASFCLGLQAKAPWLDITEESGRNFLNATFPGDKRNPAFAKRYCPAFPFEESLDHFQDRKLDCNEIIGKLVTDPDKVCGTAKAGGTSKTDGKDAKAGAMDRHKLVRDLYVLVAGMASIPQNERTDLTGLFTEREFALMWEVDNYQRFNEYFPYYPRCISVLLDMAGDASERISKGERGGNFRFGHDHVIMPLFALLGIDGHNCIPSNPDGLALLIHTWDSCMATNLQFIFYRPTRGDGDILFRILLNGHPATMAMPTVVNGCYRWKEFQDYIRLLCLKYPEISF